MNIKSMLKQATLGAAAATVFCTAPIASADPLAATGYAYGSQSFNVSVGSIPYTGSVGAGAFAGTWNAQNIIFFCVELTQYFNFGNTYNNYVPSVPNNATWTMLGQLFTQAYSAPMTTTNSAAFQLAIWEIIYDSGSGLSLGSGNFVVNSGNAATQLVAQTWLANLGNYTDNYNLILLHDSSHQDFVTFGRPFGYLVPEPTSVALLAVALLAMLAMLSRRRVRPSRDV